MKSRRVLLGQPDRREALAILQLLFFLVCRTLSYRECMLLRLWLLMGVDCCCGGSGCCGSVTEELFLADRSSCFKLAMSFFASTSLFSSVFMASHFFKPGSLALQHHSLLLRTSSYYFLFLISEGLCKSFVVFQ